MLLKLGRDKLITMMMKIKATNDKSIIKLHGESDNEELVSSKWHNESDSDSQSKASTDSETLDAEENSNNTVAVWT